MSQSPHLNGPALLSLFGGSQPGFMPPEIVASSEKPRDRIWDLDKALHCSIVGTCLTTQDGRTLLAKLGAKDARTISEHCLHGQVVNLAGKRDGGGKLLQKTLDRRHEAEIRRFEKARTAVEVRALWQDSLVRGEIPGAYWAAMTHPATDWPLVQDIFGEVHMLSHLVGQSNRADIRRLRQFEADLGERAVTIATQERRIHELMMQRDKVNACNRDLRVAQTPPGPSDAAAPVDRDEVQALELRLARERAHGVALEAKLAALLVASVQLGGDLEAEIARRQAAESELAAVELLLASGDAEASADPVEAVDRLGNRTFLYVGGRPRQVAYLRRFVENRGGRLLSHDGGIEESLGLLAGLVSRSDLVLFPVACVSHEAVSMIKRHCDLTGTPFRPVRTTGLASFIDAAAHNVTRALSVVSA